MGELVELLWEGGGYGPRKDRAAYRYHAYLPDEIAEWDVALASGAATAVDRATAALAILNASGVGFDLEALAGPLLRAEAVGSSFIEGLRVSHKNLAVADYDTAAAAATAHAVLGNVRAMERAIDLGAGNRPFDAGVLTEIHALLLAPTTDARFGGQVRTEQNWIGGRSGGPRGADFVPPPWPEVARLLDDLARFCNRDDLPPVVQAAVAHAQFETIHPFADGNGRTGRCLIHALLRRRGVTSRFSPPISVVLAANAREYIASLTAYRAGDVSNWCGHFADTVRLSVESAEGLGARLTTLLEELHGRVGKLRADATAAKIIDDLPAHPIVSAATVAARYGISDRAARNALNQLEKVGVLALTRVGRRRDREWSNDDLFNLLDEFDYGLATPHDASESRRAAPTRHRRPPA